MQVSLIESFYRDKNMNYRNLDVSKSADLTSIQASDPISLREAKEFIVERVTEWSIPSWGIWRAIDDRTVIERNQNFNVKIGIV